MTLSPRQTEALQCLANGIATKNAPDVMGITYGTYKAHLQNAYRRLGVRNDAHAVAIAMRKGLIE
ncbi:MAG: helix-turn-helix transcriptional regulator [Sulfuricaulis sp.]|nr:helix-turn-helix transcriptional regulator [Sulfuricaulis sp.]